MQNHFREQAIDALADKQLRDNFRGAMDFLRAKRQSAFPDVDELAELRSLGHQIKAKTLARLPDLLEQLETNLTNNGIQVHWAETAAQANEIIHSIIKRHDGKLAVKGKSMVSEEIATAEELSGEINIAIVLEESIVFKLHQNWQT